MIGRLLNYLALLYQALLDGLEAIDVGRLLPLAGLVEGELPCSIDRSLPCVSTYPMMNLKIPYTLYKSPCDGEVLGDYHSHLKPTHLTPASPYLVG